MKRKIEAIVAMLVVAVMLVGTFPLVAFATDMGVELRRVGSQDEMLSSEELLAIRPQDRLPFVVFESQRELDMIRHIEMAIVYYTNVERARVGAPPVMWSESLANAARVHSLDTSLNNASGHTGSDGSTPAQRVQRVGLSVSVVGENWAGGLWSNPEGIVRMWMNSSGHRATLLGRNFRVLGVGMQGGHFTQKFTSGDVHDAVPLETVFCHDEFRRIMDYRLQLLMHDGRYVAVGTFYAYHTNDGSLQIFERDFDGSRHQSSPGQNPSGLIKNGTISFVGRVATTQMARFLVNFPPLCVRISLASF